MITLRENQQRVIAEARRKLAAGTRRLLIQAPCGFGKCLGRGTPVIMYDGTVKAAEDVAVGDQLMGPDSKPRVVTSLARGREAMYRVTPVAGDPYVVNESHILSLRNERGSITNYRVDRVLRDRAFLDRRGFKGWRVPGVLRGDITPELTEISIEPIGEDDYFGFEISGPDRLFLLGDFTVTHNTVVGSYMAQSAVTKGNSVFFLTHRDELARQASRTFDNFGVEHGFVAAGITYNRFAKVHVAMIDTLRNRLEKVRPPKLMIVDECHHGVSPSWQRVIDYYHRRGTVIVGLSATPERLDGKPLNDLFDDMVLGPSVKSLIADGSLSDYVYYAPPVIADLDSVSKRYGDFNTAELAARMDKPQVFGDAIKHYRRVMPGKRAIAFNPNIEASKHFVEQCRAQGIPALHVDGEMNKDERKAGIASFERGETLILSNVSLFGEGFDVRACDGVIMLRKTASLSLFIQMCGRAMRPHESKDKAIILDHVGNVMHGMPDEDHQWSLDGRKRSERKKSEDDIVVALAKCDACHATFPSAPLCPECGATVAPPKQRQAPEQVDGDLVVVTKEMQAQLKRAARREVAAARSYEDLERIEKERGYKRGWARNVFNSRSSGRDNYQRQ